MLEQAGSLHSVIKVVYIHIRSVYYFLKIWMLLGYVC